MRRQCRILCAAAGPEPASVSCPRKHGRCRGGGSAACRNTNSPAVFMFRLLGRLLSPTAVRQPSPDSIDACACVQTVAAVHNLLREAEALLALPVDTIPDKVFMPPDGDKRSYVSLSTYCWPSNPDDTENPKGPWECRDGQPFPGVRPLHHAHRSSDAALNYHQTRRRTLAHVACVVSCLYLCGDAMPLSLSPCHPLFWPVVTGGGVL